MKRILFPTLLVCLLALTANFLISSRGETTQSTARGVFYGYLSSEPTNLDPARGVDVNEGTIQSKIFDGLVRFDEKMRLVSGLAESWTTSPDGKVFTFRIKPNVKFHNGSVLTAEDVVFSLDRILDPKVGSPRSWVLEKVLGANDRLAGKTDKTEGIRAINESTVEIELATTFAPFISLLTMPACYILPASCKKEIENRTFFELPSGTGPFRITERVRDSYVRLIANEFYHSKSPMVNKIEYRVIPENMKAEMEFESGNLDMLQLYPSNYERFKEDKKCASRIHNVPAMNVFYVGFNNQVAPFNDVRVRKALNYLINREKIINAVYQGRAVPAKGSIPPGISGFNKDLAGYGYDPDKAMKLLKEAGYTKDNPLKFDLYQKSSQAAFEITRLLQGELKKHGVKVSLKPMEWSALKDSINKGEAPCFYLSWFGDYPDGENFLYPLFHSNNWGSGGNRARFKDAGIDKMIEDAVKIQDNEIRAKAYAEVNRKIVEQAPWLYLWHCSESYLLGENVSNLEFSPMFFCDKALTLQVKD